MIFHTTHNVLKLQTTEHLQSFCICILLLVVQQFHFSELVNASQLLKHYDLKHTDKPSRQNKSNMLLQKRIDLQALSSFHVVSRALSYQPYFTNKAAIHNFIVCYI